jgi:hypothetical protein
MELLFILRLVSVGAERSVLSATDSLTLADERLRNGTRCF